MSLLINISASPLARAATDSNPDCPSSSCASQTSSSASNPSWSPQDSTVHNRNIDDSHPSFFHSPSSVSNRVSTQDTDTSSLVSSDSIPTFDFKDTRDPAESFESAVGRSTGREILAAGKEAMKHKALMTEQTTGTWLWETVQTAYFRGWEPTVSCEKEDRETFQEKMITLLLNDLGQHSFAGLEAAYDTALHQSKSVLAAHLSDLLPTIPQENSSILAGFQGEEFRRSAEAYLSYVETHPQAPLEDDIICPICGSGDTTSPAGPIVICAGCEIGVHTKCYRIDSLPDSDWFCDPCSLGVSFPTCIICSNSFRGAFHQTRSNETPSNVSWGHITCAQCLPHRIDSSSGRPIIYLSEVRSCPEAVSCSLCTRPGGLFLACQHIGCGTNFHPECWRRLTLSQGLDSTSPYYCGRHHPNGLRISIKRNKDRNSWETLKIWKALAKTKTDLGEAKREKRRGGKIKIEEEKLILKKRRLVKRKKDTTVVLELNKVDGKEGLWEQRKPEETEAEWERYLSI